MKYTQDTLARAKKRYNRAIANEREKEARMEMMSKVRGTPEYELARAKWVACRVASRTGADVDDLLRSAGLPGKAPKRR